MMPMLQENWWLLLIALVIGIIVAWWIFVATRRASVGSECRDVLDEGAAPSARNQALIDAPPAATKDIPVPPAVPGGLAGAGQAVSAVAEDAAVARKEPAAASGDDLTRIKGLGPKLQATLADLGITRFEQIASWSEADIDRIDTQLGRFQGRIRRDDWVTQAKLLASGDETGFSDKFGAV